MVLGLSFGRSAAIDEPGIATDCRRNAEGGVPADELAARRSLDRIGEAEVHQAFNRKPVGIGLGCGGQPRRNRRNRRLAADRAAARVAARPSRRVADMTCDSGLDMAGIGMGVMMMGRRRVDDRRGSRRNARRDNPGSAHGERGQGRNGKSDSPEQGKHRHPTKLWPRPGNHTVEQESLQYGDARRDGLARTPRQSHAKRVAPPDGLRDGELGHHSHSAAHRLKQDLLARRNFRRARRARPVEPGGRLIEIE